MNSELSGILHNLPDSPGVYQFIDKNNIIIYIGKAKSLKKRVNTYFKTKKHENNKLNVLVKNIYSLQYIVVESESDALLLENNLIKKYQPKYNVQLKDDKSFPWICIKNERFPRVFYTRNIIDDGSKYFGPYTSLNMVRTLLNLIKQLYKLRTCNFNLTDENIKSEKFKVCLEYHIGNCLAPCIGNQSANDYNEQINQIKYILKGNINSVSQYLKKLMDQFANDFKYEEAQQIKDKIEIIEKYKSKSTIVNPKINNIDVFSIINDKSIAYVNYIKVLNGGIIQSHTVELKKMLNESLEDLLVYAILDIREKVNSDAKEILVPFKILHQIKGIKITQPIKGDRKRLLELSERNAKYYKIEKNKRIESSKKFSKVEKLLQNVQKDLKLKEKPVFIECFDNSNIQGTNPVAACVVFKNGKPLKKEYRRFNIKSVKGPNDFASMEEVVYRRYKRLIDEKKPLPQLIIIDGGKGQLSSALNSLKRLKIDNKTGIIGIAKKLEELYFPGDSIPVYLDKNSETLKLIQNLRNEAHRFGISFHRQKRSKAQILSEIEKINGIGEKTKTKLFENLKSIHSIKNSSLKDLTKIIGKDKAKIIFNYFNK